MKGIIAIDVETTGINPEKERMIELAAFRPETGEWFQTLISPGRPLPGHIVELTGIADEMLSEAPKEKEAMEAFFEFLQEDTILLGHNVGVDYSFLIQAIRRLGWRETKFFGIDTLKLSRVLCPQLPNKKLETMVAHFGLTNERPHRALEDAKVTANLYQCLKAMNKEPDLFEPMPLCFKAKKIEPMTKKQRSFLNAILEYHHLEGQYQLEDLTKSEASRLADKLLLTYGRIPYHH